MASNVENSNSQRSILRAVKQPSASTIIICTKDDLKDILVEARQFNLSQTSTLSLSLAGLTLEEQTHYDRRLNVAWRECGCIHGTIGAIVAVLGTALVNVLGIEILTSSLIIYIVAFVVGGIFGKFIGLFYANFQIRCTVHEILNLV